MMLCKINAYKVVSSSLYNIILYINPYTREYNSGNFIIINRIFRIQNLIFFISILARNFVITFVIFVILLLIYNILEIITKNIVSNIFF